MVVLLLYPALCVSGTTVYLFSSIIYMCVFFCICVLAYLCIMYVCMGVYLRKLVVMHF